MRGGRLAAALRGAKSFVAGMRELDEAMVLLFSDHLLRATPFVSSPNTSDSIEVEDSPAGTWPGIATNAAVLMAFPSFWISLEF
jgi:hypothetical protein